MHKKLKAFERLLSVMDELREKCPWDKKQTLESLRHLTIEETYELSDAILSNNIQEVKNELGDLMLHLVFYSKIASENNFFNIEDVLNGICKKLIHRHPHIYSDIKNLSEEEVKKNWEKLKLQEGKKSVLEGVPNSLPAIIKAHRIQEKVKGVGFEWKEVEDVINKIKEEVDELQEELKNKEQSKIEDEFGDILFSLINYARYIGVNAEDALEKTNKKFISRFNYIEQYAKKSNRELSEMSLEEMDKLWVKSKGI